MTYKWFIDETESHLAHLYDGAEGRAIAVRLLQHFCGISPYEHLVEPYGVVAEEYLFLLQSAVQQLAAARPLQYVIGYQEFLGRNISVEEGVLIPRPETEELVMWVVEYLNRIGGAHSQIGENISIIDAACGSGAIAVSLAASSPQSQIYAFDISEKALEITRRNCERLLSDSSQVKLFKYDLLNGRDNLVNSNMLQIFGRVDVIVSNPPYVTNSEKAAMQKNVLDYEPEEALFVPDNDPLIFYKSLERFASQCLKPGGAIFLEINEQFGSEVAAIFKEAGYGDIEIRQDVFGKERMVCCAFLKNIISLCF